MEGPLPPSRLLPCSLLPVGYAKSSYFAAMPGAKSSYPEASRLRTKPQQIVSQNKLPSFKLLVSGIVPQNQKMTKTTTHSDTPRDVLR